MEPLSVDRANITSVRPGRGSCQAIPTDPSAAEATLGAESGDNPIPFSKRGRATFATVTAGVKAAPPAAELATRTVLEVGSSHAM
ncbi:MAG: hypothetical protein NVSMB57_02550 [Actinomycetota bacterium]